MDQSPQQQMATDECCRICLTVKNDMNSDSDRHLNSSKFFQDIFLNFTGIDVLEMKTISSWICDDCEDKLMDFHRFRQQCCESNNTLLEREILERLERIDESFTNISIKEPEEVPESKNLLKNVKVPTVIPEEQKLKTAEVVNNVPNVAGSQMPVKLEIVYNEPSFPGFEKLYECSYCFKTYQQDQPFMDHLKIHQPKGKEELTENECKVCFKVLQDEPSVAVHFILVHIQYLCEECDKHFRAYEVPKHITKCQSQKKSGIDISLKEDQNVPEVIHTEAGNKVRDVAGLQTSKHYQVYGETTFPGFKILYECSDCFKTYQQHLHSSFMDHLKIHQPKGQKKSQKNECNVCLKVLKTEKSMQAHCVSSHIQYLCEGCHKHFRSNEVPRHKCLPIVKSLVKAANLDKTTVVPKYEAPLSCRTCLSTSGHHFVDIFHSTFNDAFQCCTGIDVKSTPGITTSVCDVCEAKLMDFYNFQKKCWKSDLVLRKKFKN